MAIRTIGLVALALVLASAAGAAPGNGKLAYFRNPSVFVSNEDGSGETKIATLPDFAVGYQVPLWSPDGTHLAYVTAVESPGIVDLVPEVVDSDGGDPKQLAAHGDFSIACWLDASTLVAVDTHEMSTNPTTFGQDLYAFGLDGSVRRLTSDGGTKYVSRQGCSPDGSAVAYAKHRPDYTFTAYEAHRDGSAPTPITPAGASDFAPAWSPAGDRLAFERGSVSPGLYVSDASGADAVRLTARPASDILWSPDGARLIFTYAYTDYSRCYKGNCPSATELWSIGADGSGERALASGGADRVPTWSPDGTRILFMRANRAFFMNADGSCKTALAETVNDSVSWQPVPASPAEQQLSCADLKVSTDATQFDLALRGQAVYTVTVLNQGNLPASSVQLHQPAAGNLAVITAEPSEGTCTTGAGVVCDLGPLPSGASATVKIAIQAGGPSHADLRPSVSAPEPDGDPYDNVASVFVRVHDCTILGTVGPDLLLGTARRDRICGLFGDDKIYGGKGNDTIYGGEGADTIFPGPGRDVVDAGGGEDIVLARDGERDVIDCGTEKDVAVVDRKDVVSHCKTVYRPKKPAPRRRLH